MYSLIYLSIADKVFQQYELTEILEQSRSWNKDHDLTGCLAYIEGNIMQEPHCRFIQVLEGPKHEVLGIFEKIQHDPRHTEVSIIKQGQIERRNFESWEMGFEKVNLGSRSALQNFFKLDPVLLASHGDINSNILMDFMKSFYEQL